MPEGWTRTSLSEAIELQRGFDLPAKTRTPGDIPVVASTSVVGTHNVAKVSGPGIVIGRSGSIGGAQWIASDFWPLNTTLWVKDLRGNDPKYIYYLLSSVDFSSFNVGSGVPTLNRNHLSAITLLLPPLAVQRRIAGVLGNLDDLIDTNQRLAATLDEEVRLLGDHLLTSVPALERRSLCEIAEIQKGYSYKSAELVPDGRWLVNLKNVGRDGTFQERGFKPLSGSPKQSQMVENGDIIVSQTDLTQSRDVIARPVRVRRSGRVGEMVASLDLLIVRPKSQMTREYLFAVLSQPEFRAHALGYCNGTTVLHMGAKALPEYEAPILDEGVIRVFTHRVKPLLKASDALLDEARELKQTRDELLPLLISGRVIPGEAA